MDIESKTPHVKKKKDSNGSASSGCNSNDQNGLQSSVVTLQQQLKRWQGIQIEKELNKKLYLELEKKSWREENETWRTL